MGSPIMRNDRGVRLNLKETLKKRIELASKEVTDAPVKKTHK